MDIVLDIIKLLIPSLAVVATVYIMLDKHFKQQLDLKKIEKELNSSQTSIPVKLQAYERLVLFADRIAINNLLLRLGSSGKTVRDFQMELIETIRSEYEYNMSQQIYVSNEAWQALIEAKEKTLIAINESAAKLNPKDSSVELIKLLFEDLQRYENPPTSEAIYLLKKEVTSMLA